MLPEKLASVVTARDDFAAAMLSTPRIIVRIRGKALSLRLRHSLRCCGEPVPLAADAQPRDRHGPGGGAVAGRRKGGGFRLGSGAAVSETRGRPWMSCAWQWTSTATLANPSGWWYQARSMVCLWQARSGTLVFWSSLETRRSVHGWAAVLSTSPDEQGIEVVGGYQGYHCGPARVGLHQPGCASRLPCRVGVLGDAHKLASYPDSK
jgi:hypothetical protein